MDIFASIPQNFRTTPRSPVDIDFSHPLLNGVQSLLFPSPALFSETMDGWSSWGSIPFGGHEHWEGAELDGSSLAFYRSATALAAPRTYICKFKCNALPASAGVFIYGHSTGTSDSTRRNWLGINSSGACNHTAKGSTTGGSATTATGFVAAGDTVMIVGREYSTSSRDVIAFHGNKASISATNATTVVALTAAYECLGGQIYNTATPALAIPSNIKIEFAMSFNRCISDEEAQMIFDNPYQIFKRPNRVYTWSAGVGVGTYLMTGKGVKFSNTMRLGVGAYGGAAAAGGLASRVIGSPVIRRFN